MKKGIDTMNNLSKTFLNQWESMGFHKLILDFANPAMTLVKNIFRHSLIINFFVTQGLQNFLKNLEKRHVGLSILKYKSSSKIDLL